MSGPGKNCKPSGKHEGKAKKPPAAPVEDADVEDGDIATPKRDRYGEDEPLQGRDRMVPTQFPPLRQRSRGQPCSRIHGQITGIADSSCQALPGRWVKRGLIQRWSTF